MYKENEETLPPQRSWSPSGRRVNLTIPGADISPSDAGPAFSIQTGESFEMATVEESYQNYQTENYTFSEDFLETNLGNVGSAEGNKDEVRKINTPIITGNSKNQGITESPVLETPRVKRKAHVSPGVISLSEDEEEMESRDSRENRTTIRKIKDLKKKKTQVDEEVLSDATEGISRIFYEIRKELQYELNYK